MWNKSRTALLIACFGAAACGIALACQVPVFRYALERWTTDIYQVKIVAANPRGELSESETQIVTFLQEAKASSDHLPNFSFEVVPGETAESRIELYYPPKNRGAATKKIWEGPLTAENAKKIVNSPTRSELLRRILSGESIVWIFMPGIDPEMNQVARLTMDESIATAREKITVPEGVVTDTHAETHGFSGDPEDVVSSGVPLKIDFSVVEISRDDPAEEIFIAMFLNLEDDLYDFSDSAMAFPVFGRGRVLEPLIGKGINPDTILEYSSYLCGACSCEVKDQNPGRDLLVAANWDSAIEGSTAFLEKILPPLEGTAALTGQAIPVVATELKTSSPYRAWIIIIGAVLLGLAIASQLIKRRATK